MISRIIRFFEATYKVKTSIKRDATSRKIMESLVNSNYYSGEVTLYDGFFIPRKRFPNQTQIYLTTSKDDFYIVRNDLKFFLLRYRLSTAFIFVMVFSWRPLFNGNYYLILLIPLLFWLVARIGKLFSKEVQSCSYVDMTLQKSNTQSILIFLTPLIDRK
jgi:hypothetical protein